MSLVKWAALAVAVSGSAAAEPQLVTAVNLNTYKAIFDKAQVPYTVETANGGQFLAANANGLTIYVAPLHCTGGQDAGNCISVGFISEVWQQPVSVQQVNDYNAGATAYSTIYLTEKNHAIMRNRVFIGEGVAATYPETVLVNFYEEEQKFDAYVKSLSPAAAAATAPPGFSAQMDNGALTSTSSKAMMAKMLEEGAKEAPALSLH